MHRILRPFSLPHRKRPLLALIALLVALSLLFSDYTVHQRRALALEDVYDPPDSLPLSLSPSSASSSTVTASKDETEKGNGNGSDTREASKILLVSALFSLPQGNSTAAKMKREQHLRALARFLAETETDVYLFTTPQLGPALSALLPPPPPSSAFASTTGTTRQTAQGAEPHLNQTQTQTQSQRRRRITIDTSYTSPFDIPPLKGREAVYRFAVKGRVAPSGKVGRRVSSIPTPGVSTDGFGYERVEEVYAARNARPFLLGRAVEALSLRSEGKGEGEGEGEGGAEGRGEYGFVFWCDSDRYMLGGGGGQMHGEKRDQPAWGAWPDVGRVRRVWEEGRRVVGASASASASGREESEAELMFIPIIDAPPRRDSAWTQEMGPLEGTFALASFFGGPPPAVKWFARTFYAQHDYFLRMGYASTVSSSTSSTSSPSANTNANAVFNSLLVLYPHRFITVWPRDPDAPARLWGGLLSTFLGSSLGVGLGGGGRLGACGSQGEGEEGYVRWYLAGRAVRERWRAYWLGLGKGEDGTEGAGGSGGRSGRTWTWAAGMRTPCRLTRVLSVQDVLVRAFGRGWRAPFGGSGRSAAGRLRPWRVW